jgi:ABC-type transport system involved in multi-copper enzyme maturation permease subunit
MSSAAPGRLASEGSGIAWALLRKELLEHLAGHRVVIGALFCLLLSALSAFVRIDDIRHSHHERQQFLQRWVPSVEEQLERDENIQIENTRAVSSMSVFSIGLEPTVPFRFLSTKEGLRYGETRAARNTLDALFGHVDFAFVIGTLLSLFAVILTFDSICGERADGTLALLLSYPLRRITVVFAKVGAAVIVLLLCVVPSLALVLLLMSGFGIRIMSAKHVLLFVISALLYVTFFAIVGVVISARFRRRTDAALAAVLVWVVFVFAMPRAVSVAVNGLRSPSRAVELALRQDEMESRLKVEYARRQRELFREYVRGGGGSGVSQSLDDFRRQLATANDEMRRRRRAALLRIWEESDREEQARQRAVFTFTFFSPTAVFNQIAAELSWTGYAQRDHFYRESRAYDDNYGRRLAESREIFFAATGDGFGKALVTRANVRPYMTPFKPTWIQSGVIVRSVAFPIAALAALDVLLAVAAVVTLQRLDVRV